MYLNEQAKKDHRTNPTHKNQKSLIFSTASKKQKNMLFLINTSKQL